MMQNCRYFLMNIWFDQFFQIFVKLFAKNMNSWSVKHEILCAEQSDRAEKKVENKIFNSAAHHGANICQIFVYKLCH